MIWPAKKDISLSMIANMDIHTYERAPNPKECMALFDDDGDDKDCKRSPY